MPPAYRGFRTTGDLQVKPSAGYINKINISNVTVAGTLTVYNSLTEGGAVLYQVTLGISNAPISIPLEQNFDIGLFIGFDGTLAGQVQGSFL